MAARCCTLDMGSSSSPLEATRRAGPSFRSSDSPTHKRKMGRRRRWARARALLVVSLALALVELAPSAEASAAIAAAAAAAVEVAAGENLNATAPGAQRGKGTSGSRLPRWLGFGTASEHRAPLACRLRGKPAPFDIVEVYRQLTDCRGLPSPHGSGQEGSAAAAADRLRTKEKVAMLTRWALSCFWATIKALGRFWYNALFRHPTTLLIWGIGTFVVFVGIHIWLAAGSARQISSLAAFEDMNEGMGLYEAEFELESDEYEFEDDSEAEQPTDPLMAKPLRRAFSLSSGHRRKGSDGQVKRPPSNMVRITSSDPSSTLSMAPIHLELDRFGGRTTSASPFKGASAARRREGGRLLAGAQGAGASSGRQSPASGRQSPGSPTRPTRPPRIRPVGQPRSPRRGAGTALGEESSTSIAATAARAASPSSEASSDTPGLTSSYSSESQASLDIDQEYRFVDAAEGEPEVPEKPLPAPEGPPSILKRKPETFGGIPHVPLSTGPYPSSSGGFTSTGMPWETRSDGHISYDGMPEFGHAQKQGEGGAIDGMPLGYPGMAPLPSVTSGTTGSLPPGAAHAPGTALAQAAPVGPAPKLGSLTPAQIRAAWPVKRQKRIRLVEPDWEVHAETHDRARERIETAAIVASHPNPSSLEYMPPSRGSAIWDDEEKAEEDERCREFWFERYTQSTAAAGRDWDWRKRRARRRAAAAAAGRPYLSSSTISLPAGVGAGDGAGVAGLPIQQQEHGTNSTRTREARQRIAKQAPLISFTAEELSPKLPPLSVDTSLTGSPRGGTSDTGTPTSPLNRAIRQLRSSSYSGTSASGSPPSSPKNEPPIILGSVAGDGRSSPNGSVRQRMGKMMRRSTLGDGDITAASAFPVLPGTTSSSSALGLGSGSAIVRQRRHSDMDAQKSAEGDEDDSLSVPSRLSSLKPRGRLSSLRDSKRDATIAPPTAALGVGSLSSLLTQPLTPGNEDSRLNSYRDGLSTSGLRSPGDEAPAPPSLIYADSTSPLPVYPRSSADAYGSSSTPAQQAQQLHDDKIKQGQLPDIPDEAEGEEDEDGPRWWEEMEAEQQAEDSLINGFGDDTVDILSPVREESFDSPVIGNASIAPIVNEPETAEQSTPPRQEPAQLDDSPSVPAQQAPSASNGMLSPTFANGDSIHRTTSQTSSASTSNSRPSTPRKRLSSTPKRQSNGVASSKSSTGSGSSPNRRPGSARGLGVPGDPPVVRITPRSGSRKGILAGTVDNDLAARTRHARAPALQKAAAEATSRHPRPMEQPEPAPTAMASRARSASVSSHGSASKDTISSASAAPGVAVYLSGSSHSVPSEADTTSPNRRRRQSTGAGKAKSRDSLANGSRLGPRPSSASSASPSSTQDGAPPVPPLPNPNAIWA